MKAVVFLLCLLAASAAQAQQLLSDAVLIFPAQTKSLEYDNLKLLRTLPNYRDLRKQYSNESLNKVQKTLRLLGISEDQLTEVVTAAGPGGFFGLLAGNIRLAVAQREAAKQEFIVGTLGEGSATFCSPQDVCFFFSGQEDGRTVFGSLEQLRKVFEVRQSHTGALKGNAAIIDLLSRADPRAPVVGIAPGSEIGQFIGDSVSPEISSRFNFANLFSSIEIFGYSVIVDNKAHVSVNMLCKSETEGKLLSDTLAAASGLQRMAAMAVGNAMPFENMAANSFGRMVALRLDAPLTQ